MYRVEGGGIGFQYSDLLELPFKYIKWFLERLNTQRRNEADAVEKARRG